MKKLKLFPIFEAILTGGIVDLNKYPALKAKVDLYKTVKVGGKPVIVPTDFDSLLTDSPETKDVTLLLSRGNFQVDYENTSPQGRVYNFIKGLYENGIAKKIKRADFQTFADAYDDTLDLLRDIIDTKKSGTTTPNNSNNNPNPNNNPNNSTGLKIGNTSRLKNMASVQDESGKNYQITDAMVGLFQNGSPQRNDPKVMYYYNAMDEDKINLPDDFTSEAGLVYTLYKRLKTSCTNNLSNYTQARDKLGGLSMNMGVKNQNKSTITQLDQINLSDLHRGSEIKITYKLKDINGNPHNGTTSIYSSTFIISPLSQNYKLVNKTDLNVSFIFAGTIPTVLERGKEYEIRYKFNLKDIASSLLLEVVMLEGLADTKASTTSGIESCTAMDELLDVIGFD